MHEIIQAAEMFQPFIADPGVVEMQKAEFSQAAQMREPGVAELRVVQG